MMIIGICGPSNSGKSSLCKFLAEKYNANWIEVDHYLKNKKEIPFKGKYRNWELPNNHNFVKLIKDLKHLNEGKKIKIPIYSFKKGKIKGYKEVTPKNIVFVEGFYLFYNKQLRDFFDIKIYLDLSIKELIKRRICTEEEYEWTQKEYLNKIVIPMYKKYGLSQKKYADFIVNGNKSFKEVKDEVTKILKLKTK